METTYAFTAYNTETQYAFGTEAEARKYLEILNADKEINLYELSVSDLTDDEADTLAFNLRDCIHDI